MTDQPPRAHCATSFIEVEFVCTRKGQHRPYSLLRAMVGPGPDDFDPLTDYASFRPAERVSLFGGESTYDEFRCPKCRRNPRIVHERFVELRRGLHREGIARFDISQMPF